VGCLCSGSFQRIRRAIELSVALDWRTRVWSPRLAIPVVCELNPCAWAPITARSMPPARPSQIFP